MLVGALYGGSVAVRQILLHIVPGTGTYGSAILGLHYYTWSAIFFFLILAGTALMLLFDRQFDRQLARDGYAPPERFGGSALAKIAFAVLLLTTALNAGSTLLECGPLVCDDNPTSYKLLDEI
jgi:hypothetical protein